MSVLPVSLARVSNLLRTDVASQQIASAEQQMLQVENQISTGQRVNTPSDDPGASAVIMQLQRTLDQGAAYTQNLQQSQSQLSEVDTQLGSLTDLVQQAYTIAQQNASSTVSAQQRQSAAAIVQTLYSQAISIGNTQFDGSYIFGGDKATDAPFVDVNGGVEFVGSTNTLQNAVDDGTRLAFQVNGADVFGALSTQVAGSRDLAPNLTATTRIADLRGAGGNGVRLGTIQLGNGATTKLVDLSQADTVQDVVNAIDKAGVGNITASINGNHLVLSTSGTDNITVADVGGGSTAADLGIAMPTGGGAGASVVGAGLAPNVTPLTSLAALNGGAGIDTTHGMVITNGTATATVSLVGVTTVEGLLNAINSSGTNVRAQINAAARGIDILNPVQGTQMTIAENGGTTAADLGVRSFSPATQLADLNGGAGVHLAATGPDFQITNSQGASFTVTLSGAQTVQDAIARINASSGTSGVSAAFASTGNGIVLTDASGGAGTMSVTPLNFSTAAADLGISGPATGNTIKGADVASVEASGVFGNLAKLRDALNANDTNGITEAAQALQSDQNQVVTVRGQAGAAAQEVQNRQTTLQAQSTATQALLSQLRDTDMPTAISQFTTLQTAYQASLQTTALTGNISLMNFLA